MKILSDIFHIFYLLEHTQSLVWILWSWHCNWNLLMFDLLTSPQGHKFDHGVKILFALCTTHHSRQFDMPHNHVKRDILCHCAHPPPQVPPVGHDPGVRTKSRSICFISFNCKSTHTVWKKKSLKLTLLLIFNDIWPFDTSPGSRAKLFFMLHAPFMWVAHTPNLVGFCPMV